MPEAGFRLGKVAPMEVNGRFDNINWKQDGMLVTSAYASCGETCIPGHVETVVFDRKACLLLRHSKDVT